MSPTFLKCFLFSLLCYSDFTVVLSLWRCCLKATLKNTCDDDDDDGGDFLVFKLSSVRWISVCVHVRRAVWHIYQVVSRRRTLITREDVDFSLTDTDDTCQQLGKV